MIKCSIQVCSESYIATPTCMLLHDFPVHLMMWLCVSATGDFPQTVVAFAFALANDYKFKYALEFANKVAAISTTKFGAANSMPRLNEIEKY